MGLGAKTWYPANDERNANYRLLKAEQRAHSQYVDELHRINRLRELRERRDQVGPSSKGGMSRALNFPAHGTGLQPAAYISNHGDPHTGGGGRPSAGSGDTFRASDLKLNAAAPSPPAGGNNSAANQASHQQGGGENNNDQQSKTQGRGQVKQSDGRSDSCGCRSALNNGNQQDSGRTPGNNSSSPKKNHESSNNQSAKNKDGNSKSSDNASNNQLKDQAPNMQLGNDTYTSSSRNQAEPNRLNNSSRIENQCTCANRARAPTPSVQGQNQRNSTSGKHIRNNGSGSLAAPVSILRNASAYGSSAKLSDFAPQYLDSGSSTYKPFKPRSPLEPDLFGEYDSIFRENHRRAMRDLNLRLGELALTGSRRSSSTYM